MTDDDRNRYDVRGFTDAINDPAASKSERYRRARLWWSDQHPGSGYIGDAFAHWVAELPAGVRYPTMADYRHAFASNEHGADLYRVVHGSMIADPTGGKSWTYVPDEWSTNPGAGVATLSLGGLMHALVERDAKRDSER